MLCNAAGYSTQCVAELAIGLTIACLRNMPDCETAVRTGGVGGALRGREIGGCTVGIVGTGAIGTMTARLFQAFGAKVIAYSRTVRPEVEEMGISYVSLETLMAQSDIVSLHLPSNPQTKGMISRAMLQKMKPTAILINVARGAVVDNTALAEALNQEKIAGAGIDVFGTAPSGNVSSFEGKTHRSNPSCGLCHRGKYASACGDCVPECGGLPGRVS